MTDMRDGYAELQFRKRALTEEELAEHHDQTERDACYSRIAICVCITVLLTTTSFITFYTTRSEYDNECDSGGGAGDAASNAWRHPVPPPGVQLPSHGHSSPFFAFISPASSVLTTSTYMGKRALYEAHVSNISAAMDVAPQVFAPHAFDIYQGYLAGTDANRSSDVMWAFAQSGAAMIVSNRGGYGTDRLLDQLDYDAIVAQPKPIMGYSDLTALLNAIHTRTGMITYHGPMGIDAVWNDVSAAFVQQATFVQGTPDSDVVLANSVGYTETTVVRSGKARGRLIGGNLSVFSSILGAQCPDGSRSTYSCYLPSDFSDVILFLEEVGEKPYSIDRMFAQLRLSGMLSQIKGFVFGACTSCSAEPETWMQVVREYVEPLGVPAFMDGMFGHHLPQQYTLPIGVMATMDADAGTITYRKGDAVKFPADW